MPSDESKGSQLDAIGSLAQRQLDNTVAACLKVLASLRQLVEQFAATPCCCAGRYHLHLVTSAGCSVRYYTRRVQKYKRTLRPARRAVAEFIYHYRGERNHQGLGNAFVFLDTTRVSTASYLSASDTCAQR